MNSLPNTRVAPIVIAIAIASNAIGGSALAQEDAQVLEEILVTAQKREQSLKEVPISISVMSGEKIVSQGFNDLEEISTFLPGLTVEQGDVVGTTLSIRGINSAGNNAALEQAVAVFNDGIYNGRSMQSVAGVYDVSQVEVLFGPQPVYFGQSAIAGLVSYSSKRPGDEWDGYAVVEAGNFNFRKLEGAVGGPISENWGIRLAGKYTETDGWTKVFATGEDGNASEDSAFRISLDGDITDSLSMYVKTETYEQETSGAPFPTVVCEPDFGAQLPINLDGMGGPDIRSPVGICGRLPEELVSYEFSEYIDKGGSISARDIPTPAARGHLDLTGLDIFENAALGLDVKGNNSALEFKWDLAEDLTITSLTGYSDYESSVIEDFDASPYAAIGIVGEEEFEMLSQEIRIESAYDGGFNWMAGVYYQDNELDYINRLVSGIRTQFGTPGSYVTGDYNEEATYWGFFASANWQLTDRLRLGAGVRHSEVEKSAYLMESESSLIFDAAGNVTGISAVDDSMLRARGRCLGNTPTGLDCDQSIINSGGQALLDAMGGDSDLELDDSDQDYQLTISYDINDNMTGFARYVTGFKAGGFSRGGSSFRVSTKGAYDSERATSFEFGARLEYEQVRANITFYRTEYEDRQVEAGFVDAITDPATGVTTETRSLIFINAAESTVQGFEADLTYVADFGTRVQLGFAYLDSEWDSYANAGCLAREAGNPLLALPTFPGGPRGTPAPASPDCVNQQIDLGGTEFDGVPDWNLVAAISHDFQLGDSLLLSLGVDISMFDDYDDTRGQTGQFSYDYRSQDGFTLMNARAVLSKPGAGWQLAVFGRNITDEEYWLVQPAGENPFGTTSASYARPASYGIQLRYDL